MPKSTEHLSQQEFFEQLDKLFKQRDGSNHGAVYLTQKRVKISEDTQMSAPGDPFPDLTPVSPLPIIIRASNGKSKRERSKRTKISTIVKPDDIEAFYERYAEVCKAGMTALKPRDRKKKKAKARRKNAAA